jgi:O-succinylbenzoate synthase
VRGDGVDEISSIHLLPLIGLLPLAESEGRSVVVVAARRADTPVPPRFFVVQVDSVEVRRVSLPLVEPFRTSFGVETERHAVLVRVIGDGVEGWGECVAMTEPLYSSEYADGAADVLVRHLAPRLVGRPVRAEDVVTTLAAVKGHPMAKAALELAVLDAELRVEGRSLGARLGATRDQVPAGVSIGMTTSVGELLDLVAAHVEAGYRRVKLKIARGWDLEPVAAVRDRFGDDLPLQVDGNGDYSIDDAEHLSRLDDYGLLLLEQPLAEDDLDGHAALARRLRTPICLDESITSASAAADAIARGACRVVNLKAGRVGGYLEAVRVHDVCVAAGVPVWCGGMLETGLGRAANIALAALPGFTLTGDLSASSRWFAEDITEPLELVDGHLLVPTGPGLGVEPRQEVLTRRSTEAVIVQG